LDEQKCLGIEPSETQFEAVQDSYLQAYAEGHQEETEADELTTDSPPIEDTTAKATVSYHEAMFAAYCGQLAAAASGSSSHQEVEENSSSSEDSEDDSASPADSNLELEGPEASNVDTSVHVHAPTFDAESIEKKWEKQRSKPFGDWVEVPEEEKSAFVTPIQEQNDADSAASSEKKAKREPRIQFKERTIASLGGASASAAKSESVEFKKRKIAGGARNLKRRDGDDD